MNPRLLVERVRFLLRDRDLQEELRSSRSKLLLAQSIARVGHWELGVDGRTLHVSPMLGELLGLDTVRLNRYEEFVALLDPAEQDLARTAFVTCATGKRPLRLRPPDPHGDGTVICVHQEADLVQGSGGPGDRTVIVTLQDLTRLHRAEETVRLLSYFDTATGCRTAVTCPSRSRWHSRKAPARPRRASWRSACTISIESCRRRAAISPTS